MNSEQNQNIITSFRRGALAKSQGARLSVIVCTYRRPQLLPGILKSVYQQSSLPGALIVVDASPDDETERAVAGVPPEDSLPIQLLYFRVGPSLKGLTLQRNFGLHQVQTPFVAYFDDDAVLSRDCLEEIERVMASDPAIVGAAGYNDAYRPSLKLWRMRKKLGIISDLRPGSYQRTGMSVPWSFMSPAELLVSDWLPGCGMVWKTAVIRELGGFYEGFSNYALGEDLDMSLRAGRKGKLVVVGSAKFEHLLEKGGGRPDEFRQGYMEIHNRFLIQRRCLENRTWLDTLRFTYAWTVDSLMLLRRLTSLRGASSVFRQLAGRIAGAFDLVLGK